MTVSYLKAKKILIWINNFNAGIFIAVELKHRKKYMEKYQPFISYHPNGKICITCESLSSRFPSGYTRMYHDNGNLEREGLYVNHLKDGRKSDSQFDGLWKYYDEKGQLTKTIIYDHSDIIEEKKISN